MPGKTISHYKILKKLGEGGMGVVYKAKDTRLDRTVALKLLPEHLTSDEEAKTRFIHEAKAASALDHPNIATIYEIDEAEGRSFISMAYVDGRSLKSLLKDKTLTIDQILDLGAQIAEGLSEAHRHGIVHRDVKSDNIMLSTRDVVKITDFGLAKLRGVSRVTKLGSTLGTLSYMSPEQAQGIEADNRSDIFSFGVVLYEMVTGRLPFTADHEAALMYSIVNAEPPALRDLRKDAPPELIGIIGKALEKDPDRRYQDVEELLADMRGVKKKRPSKGLVLGTKPLGTPPRTWRKVLIPVFALLVVAAGLLIGIRIQIGRQPPAEAAENILAVLYFENMVDPSDSGKLGKMVTNLVIADLSESRYIRVLSAQRLHDILRQLGREDATTVAENVASQVAEKADAKWMVTGSIMRAEPRIVLMGNLVDVPTGTIIASHRAEGHEGEDIFSVVDVLTAGLKGKLPLPLGALDESDPRVADMTTHSSEAYQHYLEGVDYVNKVYMRDAEQSFNRTLEADSTYAMAYYWLARIKQGREGRNLVEKALKYSDRLSGREKHYIKSLEALLSRDYERSIKELENIVREYPDEKMAHFELGEIYSERLEDNEEAIRHYNKVIEIDPLHKTAYNVLAYSYDAVGNFEKSIWAVNKYISLAPGEANPYDTRGELYAFNGRLDEAIESYEKALEIKPDHYPTMRNLGYTYIFKREYEKAEEVFTEFFTSGDKYVRSFGRTLLGLIPMHQGKFNEALETFNEGIASDELENYREAPYAQKHFGKAFIYSYLGDSQNALKEAEAWMRLNLELDPGIVVNMRHFYVRSLAEIGMMDKAEEVAKQLKKDIDEKDPTQMEYYWMAASFIERAKGNKREELANLRIMMEEDGFKSLPSRFFLGRALLESGKLGEAVDMLETTIGRYDRLRGVLCLWSVQAHYLLGQAYEESGWTDKAVEQYEEFLDIWTDADPGLVEVEDARRRLARLTEQL